MITYIYTLTCPTTNKIRYVGKTINPKRRLQSHLWNNPKNKTYVYKWIQKLKKSGLKPNMNIIDEVKDNWKEREIYWIDFYKNQGCKLCNITSGGEGSYGVSAHWNNSQVSIYDINGDYINVFDSVKKCSEFLCCSYSTICRVLNDSERRLLLKKYQVKYGNNKNCIGKVKDKKQYKWKNRPEIFWTGKKIKCIEDNMFFNSITEAAKYYNVLITSIANILNGKSKKTRDKKSFCYV